MSQPIAKLEIRDAFFEEVRSAVRQDPRVVVLSDDQGAHALDAIRREYPNQYYNCGIAEQNIINVAAGMALDGMRPVVCGISNFMSLRCCEQISVNLAAMNLPVTIVASGGGLTYASDGPTHHGTQDVAVMCTMPNMTVFNPCDALSTQRLAALALRQNGPTYTRIEKGFLPGLLAPETNWADGVSVLAHGSQVVLVSTGYMTQAAAKVVDELIERGVSVKWIDVFRLKPFPVEALARELKGASWVAVLEEQSSFGGLGAQLSEWAIGHSERITVKRFNLPDKPCYAYGSREWLHRELGIDAMTVLQEIDRHLNRLERQRTCVEVA